MQFKLIPALAPATLLALGASATAFLATANMHGRPLWVCPTAAVGFDCPGCGGLRSVHYMANGDLYTAASFNLLATVLVPIAAVWLLFWLASTLKQARFIGGKYWARFWIAMLPLVLVFTIARNMPGAWLGT